MMNKTCSTALREMVTYSFLWNSKFENSLKAYYSAFGQLYSSYNEFVEEFQSITKQKYQCVVYNSNCDELEDNYIPYTAPPVVKNFVLKYKI
jgi:hypothetical protein